MFTSFTLAAPLVAVRMISISAADAASETVTVSLPKPVMVVAVLAA